MTTLHAVNLDISYIRVLFSLTSDHITKNASETTCSKTGVSHYCQRPPTWRFQNLVHFYVADTAFYLNVF